VIVTPNNTLVHHAACIMSNSNFHPWRSYMCYYACVEIFFLLQLHENIENTAKPWSPKKRRGNVTNGDCARV
jgi:hypothetical protein